jgi:hypothetical protein
MRTWGRITNPDGSKTWVEVSSDPVTGDSSWVWITTLCQTLLLNLGESPLYAQLGLPAKQSVVQQVQPDFYVNRTQAYYAQYFASLVVAKVASDPPTYNIACTLFSGAKASLTMQIPQ